LVIFTASLIPRPALSQKYVMPLMADSLCTYILPHTKVHRFPNFLTKGCSPAIIEQCLRSYLDSSYDGLAIITYCYNKEIERLAGDTRFNVDSSLWLKIIIEWLTHPTPCFTQKWIFERQTWKDTKQACGY